MARPQKEGLDYFPLDVDIDNDDKFKLLEAKYQLTGFGVIIKLLMKIYSEGYFYKWGEKESLLHSGRVNVDIKIVNEIINDAVKWEIFNEPLYKKYQILTSTGIQKRFIEAIRRRNNITIFQEYWLLSTESAVYDNINFINVDINSQSKVKKSKEKESKEYYAEFVCMSKAEYQKLVDKYGEINTRRFIEKLDNYKGAHKKKYDSDYKAILTWVVDSILGKQPSQPEIQIKM